MEIEELKTIWQQYDSKLDNLEKLNKKLIMETLVKKPQRKLNWIKFQSIYGLIIPPAVIIFVLYPLFRIENIDLNFILGFLFIIGTIFFLSYGSFKSFMALKGIDLSNDSVIDAANKVNKYKEIFNMRYKYTIITYPLFYVGTILIIWKGLHFDMKTILFLIGIFVFTVVFGNKKFKMHKEKIDRLEKEILELNEYSK
jgi:hypothetical protein